MAKPIKCPECDTVVFSDEKHLEIRMLTEDVKCPQCNSLVARARRILTPAKGRRFRKKQ